MFVLQSQDPRIHDRERALRLSVEATRNQSKEWTAWYARGLAEGELGRTEEARKSLTRAYRSAPNWAQRMCRQAIVALQGDSRER